MDPTRLRERLAAGDILLGLSNNYPSAALIETVGSMWDFIWIDGQHGQFSYDNALTAVRASDLVGTDSLLRAPGHEHSLLGLYIDMFPSALMVPMVNTPAQAHAVVDATKFPPLGNRSFGGRRPIDSLGREYYLAEGPLLIAQIETPRAVENVEEIAATDGIDVLFLGADDLKIQSGESVDAPNLETEVVTQAMDRVAKAAKGAGKYSGCVAVTPEQVKYSIDLGYQILAVGGDMAMLRCACRDALELLRKVITG
ncbi:MAG: hypothetical protein JXM70_12825 [Pirellulales bacterium]|nr:hypothetical protein [Pirellulales bacterium]